MILLEKAQAVPDSAVTATGGAVAGFLVGLSLEDFQIIAGLVVAALTAAVLVQRIIINNRTLKKQREEPAKTPTGNSE